jgi:tetratricopeptide (TPR) repeat protein
MNTIRWIEDYMTRAEDLIFDGHVDQALNILLELLFDEPGYAPLHNMLGWAYLYHVKDEATAEMHFRVAIKFSPDYAPPYLHLGTMMNQRGCYADAIALFREGLNKPQAIHNALLEGIAQAHEMRSQYGQAIRTYKEAVSKSVADFDVDRILRAVKRCRRKRFAMYFSFW